MKRLFLLIAALFVSAITVSAKPVKTEEKIDADQERVLVYGITSGFIDTIEFIQMDSRLETSILKKKARCFDGGYYYGEAVPGGLYICYRYTITEIRGAYNTIYYGINGISGNSYYDFKCPNKKGQVVFLGNRSDHGEINDYKKELVLAEFEKLETKE